jgi:peptidoglycan/LPS O-acetylase OafA/YrhL
MGPLLNPPVLRGRSNGIDFLRGWFSLQVLIFAHVIFWAGYAQGPTAVARPARLVAGALITAFQGHAELNPAVLAFIVMSGYCIHRNGLRPEKSLGPYSIRRIFRIVPIFVLATVLGVVFFYLSSVIDPKVTIALNGTPNIPPLCVAAKLTAVASLWPLAHPCDFAGNAPLLTVMVEIGLYAFYGLTFAIANDYLVYAGCIASVAAGVVIAALNLRYPLLYNWWQNSSLLAFLPYWWIGAAIIVPAIRTTLKRWWPALLLAWTILTAGSYLESTGVIAEVRKLVFAGLIAVLIDVIDRLEVTANPLSHIGRAGYSIYAIHAPVSIYLILIGIPWWGVVTLVVAVGLAVYFTFERPLDRVGRYIATKTVTPPRLPRNERREKLPPFLKPGQ